MVIVGTLADGLDRDISMGVSRDDDDLQGSGHTHDLLQQAEPFGCAVRVGRQAQVQQHSKRRPGVDDFHGLPGIARHRDIVDIGEAPLQLFGHARFIFNDQDVFLVQSEILVPVPAPVLPPHSARHEKEVPREGISREYGS